MMVPNTCVAGYNNIRFDDELGRFLFYRNCLSRIASINLEIRVGIF